jgi:FdhE protein
MTASATVRVMPADEIVARGGGETPFLQLPERSTVFAERAMRLRQLAAGHPMADYLGFVAEIAQAQQRRLLAMPELALPDADALDRAARAGVPPLPVDAGADPIWRSVLRDLLADLRQSAPAATQPALQRLAAADDAFLDRQADALLSGVSDGLDTAAAPLVGAALQVLWTHQVSALQARALASSGALRVAPFGRIDDKTVCPCCGSRPTASVIRLGGEFLGQRYLHCSLCSAQWHFVRVLCSHCGSGSKVAYQSLDAVDADDDDDGARAAQSAVQAETCDACGHYLKIVRGDRDPYAEAVADDLASLTLDLLVAESGMRRHGVNLMLLFGDGAAGPPFDDLGRA